MSEVYDFFFPYLIITANIPKARTVHFFLKIMLEVFMLLRKFWFSYS